MKVWILLSAWVADGNEQVAHRPDRLEGVFATGELAMASETDSLWKRESAGRWNGERPFPELNGKDVYLLCEHEVIDQSDE